MTSSEFAAKYGFTDGDTFVINKVYKEIEKTEQEWLTELTPKFNIRIPKNVIKIDEEKSSDMVENKTNKSNNDKNSKK